MHRVDDCLDSDRCVPKIMTLVDGQYDKTESSTANANTTRSDERTIKT